MLKEDYGDLSADVKPLSEYADAPRPQQQQPQQAAAGPRRIAPMPAGEGMAPPPAAAAARADSGGLGMGAGAGLPPGASALDSRLMPQGAAATTTLVSHHPHTPSRYCCRAVLLGALCVFGTRDAVAFASMGHRLSWVAEHADAQCAEASCFRVLAAAMSHVVNTAGAVFAWLCRRPPQRSDRPSLRLGLLQQQTPPPSARQWGLQAALLERRGLMQQTRPPAAAAAAVAKALRSFCQSRRCCPKCRSAWGGRGVRSCCQTASCQCRFRMPRPARWGLWPR